MRRITRLFDRDVSAMEAQAIWDTHEDYALHHATKMTELADGVADMSFHEIDLATQQALSHETPMKERINKAWMVLLWHSLFAPIPNLIFDFDLLRSLAFNETRNMLVYYTYIQPQPELFVMQTLADTPYGAMYEAHCAFQALHTGDTSGNVLYEDIQDAT